MEVGNNFPLSFLPYWKEVWAKKRSRNEFDFIEWYLYHKNIVINCIEKREQTSLLTLSRSL